MYASVYVLVVTMRVWLCVCVCVRTRVLVCVPLPAAAVEGCAGGAACAEEAGPFKASEVLRDAGARAYMVLVCTSV
jgi:hypothetical protein